MANARPAASIQGNPQTTRDTTADGGHRRLLEGLRLDHGPIDQIGSFLLRAEKAMADRGITMFLSPISELVRVNAMNLDSWYAFSPILDVRVAPLDASNSHCITGRDQSGETVVLLGNRLIDTGERSLQEYADDQSLYYGRPHVPLESEPRCVMSVPIANELRGRLTYSGGMWVKPVYRGLSSSAILPRVSRLLALGRWGTSHTFSFVTDSLAKSPVLRAYGYENIQPSYAIVQGGEETYRGSLIWMETAKVIDDMREFMSRGFAEIDRTIGDRSGKNVATGS